MAPLAERSGLGGARSTMTARVDACRRSAPSGAEACSVVGVWRRRIRDGRRGLRWQRGRWCRAVVFRSGGVGRAVAVVVTATVQRLTGSFASEAQIILFASDIQPMDRTLAASVMHGLRGLCSPHLHRMMNHYVHRLHGPRPRRRRRRADPAVPARGSSVALHVHSYLTFGPTRRC
jgi:hypothetical protein